jgi:hypothetical protein
MLHFTVCEACGWKDEPIVYKVEEDDEEEFEEISNEANKDLGPVLLLKFRCVGRNHLSLLVSFLCRYLSQLPCMTR